MTLKIYNEQSHPSCINIYEKIHLYIPKRFICAEGFKPDNNIILTIVAQSVTRLAKDASLTADPGVASSIPARSRTFVEIDHEIISTVILLPSAESFKKGCSQLHAKLCTKYWLTACLSLPRKKCG